MNGCVWLICVLVYDICMHVCVYVQVHSFVSPHLHLYLIVFETTSSVHVDLINSATLASNEPLGSTSLSPSHPRLYMPSYVLHFMWALGI